MGEKTTLGIMLVTSAPCLDGATLHLLFNSLFRQTDTGLALFTSQFNNLSVRGRQPALFTVAFSLGECSLLFGIGLYLTSVLAQ